MGDLAVEMENVNNKQKRRDWGPLGGAHRNRANTLGDPWYRSRHDLPVSKDLVQDTRYGLTSLALRIPQRVEGFTLSKPPFISEKEWRPSFQPSGVSLRHG